MIDIEGLVTDSLGKNKLEAVKSVSKANSDGEDVLWIEIILADGTKVSGAEMASLTDKLWSEILRRNGQAFPVISYVSATDTIGTEAA